MNKERGRSSEVERQLPKLNVVGSIPIARSNNPLGKQGFLVSCHRFAAGETREKAVELATVSRKVPTRFGPCKTETARREPFPFYKSNCSMAAILRSVLPKFTATLASIRKDDLIGFSSGSRVPADPKGCGRAHHRANLPPFMDGIGSPFTFATAFGESMSLRSRSCLLRGVCARYRHDFPFHCH